MFHGQDLLKICGAGQLRWPPQWQQPQKNAPQAESLGELTVLLYARGKEGRLCSLPQRPTEHRCYILGGCSTYMQQRVRTFHRGETPSSARQLPIMAALHAEGPTLSELILHEKGRFVNPFLKNFGKTPGPMPTLPRRAESAVEKWGKREKIPVAFFQEPATIKLVQRRRE